MAWKKRYSNFRGRASGAWKNRRTYAKKGIGISAPYLAGIAVGLTDYDKMIPYEVKIAIACLPSSVVRMAGSGGSTVQRIVQGMLIGDIIQARTGFNLGGSAQGTSGSFGV